MTTSGTAVDHFITVNGLRLHYLEWGSPTAPPVIMLHGLRGYARSWQGVASTLDDRFRILAIDQRGRGESDWDPDGRYVADSYVSDLEQFVDQLGIDRFILVGHSMGGANTILYTARHPDRVTAAVIEDMGPRGDTPAPGTARITDEIDATPRTFRSWEEAREFSQHQRPASSPEALQARLDSSLKEESDGTIRWKVDLDGISRARALVSQNPVDLWPPVRAIQCPTLVLRGAQSDILSREVSEAMAQANPKIQWVEIPDASHFVHEDNLQVFNQEVHRFLSNL